MRIFEDKYLIKRNFDQDIKDIYITPECIKGSIVYCYNTLDTIDRNLISNGTKNLFFN